ncbi:PREDICTED: charged multivesicular body protein 6-A [Ceratosolen solmsi marchali]|uniref:Charged multivesicular body protein 6-A n=1 Tax=Ceratosolen solmsi marchali TaxID=326594 RepID=A0AAJ6YM34_9HYME|nr:PREDICTED: charged multivesicular body protein 6-A [Ceratosolen solmsi marchali]
MGIFFAKKKQSSRITDQDKAILQLKQTRDKLKQYQKRIEQSIEKDKEIAKKLLKNNQKDRALLLLRKKKFQEQVLIKADGQLENVERMVHDIEFAQVEVKVIDGLKFGNDALKKLHAILSIDEIEKIMDETKEGIEKQQEINIILTGALSDEDEENIEAELDDLMTKDTKEVAPESDDEILLPDVPTDKNSNKEVSSNKLQEPVALES